MRPNISSKFTESEQDRFRKLLEMANSSKYQGERANALAAAERIAGKHNMSLEEAARWTPSEKSATHHEFYQRPRKSSNDQNSALSQQNTEAEKNRWQAAMDRARERGLDKAEEAKIAAQEAASKRRRNSGARRDPAKHAMILLKETSFSFEEIAGITGLDVYQVVGMKLKSRTAA